MLSSLSQSFPSFLSVCLSYIFSRERMVPPAMGAEVWVKLRVTARFMVRARVKVRVEVSGSIRVRLGVETKVMNLDVMNLHTQTHTFLHLHAQNCGKKNTHTHTHTQVVIRVCGYQFCEVRAVLKRKPCFPSIHIIHIMYKTMDSDTCTERKN